MTTTKEEKLREEFTNDDNFSLLKGYEHDDYGRLDIHIADWWLLKRKQELERLIGELEGIKKPEEIGYYGPHDQLHIQHNIGFNTALDEAITKIKALI